MSHTAELPALRQEPALHEHGLVLRDVLGAGGTAVVYRARDNRHERDVAVKVLHRNLAGTPSEARFAQEIRVAAALRHPHVLPLFDSGTLADGRLFAVMPVAAGRPLSAYIAEGPLALTDALRLARETAEALAYLHSHGFVHRDVKPANILVEAGHAVLTDFGLATSLPTPASAAALAVAAATTGDTRLTLTGMALGTLPYMSPEALLGESQLDARADVYAVGVVLYEMLTGCLPCEARTAMEQLNSRTRDPLPQLHERCPDLPPAVEAVLVRCTDPKPDARYQSAEALAAALAAIPTGARAVPSRAARRWLHAALTIGVVALATFAWARIRGPWLDPSQVVVADFANDAGDWETVNIGVLAGDIITDAITSGTSLKVVNADVALPSRLQRQSRVADSVLARKTRILVERTHSGLVVTGAYFRRGDTHEFIAEVIDARSGRVLGVAGPLRSATADVDPAIRALAARIVSILRARASG